MSIQLPSNHFRQQKTSARCFFKTQHRLREKAKWVLILFMSFHAILAIGVAMYSSPNLDEPAHLAAGIGSWRFGRFDLYRVNPPFVRMLAAVPVMCFCDIKADWSCWNPNSTIERPEFEVGFDYAAANGAAFWNQVTLARLPCIAVALLCGWVCYKWSSALYGKASALLCVWLWAISPSFIAWDASITTDSLCATTCVLASYFYWKWYREPNWELALSAGAAMGVALTTKFTAVLLVPIWIVLSCLRPLYLHGEVASGLQPRLSMWCQFSAMLCVAAHVVNSMYLYQECFAPLEDVKFVSDALTVTSKSGERVNRFKGTVLGRIPVPLPKEYLRGIDVQKRDFELKKWSYLRGEQRLGGWWYYYLYAVLIKTPLGTLLLALLSIARALARPKSIFWRDEIHLILPLVVIFGVVSLETGFSRHSRYCLPAAPFALLLVSRVLSSKLPTPNLIKSGVIACAIFAGGESLYRWPDCMAFFNCLVGGPRFGSEHLMDSNVDWGQDAVLLRQWCLEHPTARPIRVAYFGGQHLSEDLLGTPFEPLADVRDPEGVSQVNWTPGWYVISLTYLKRYQHFGMNSPDFSEFLRLEPVHICGSSIYIFEVGERQLEILGSTRRTSIKANHR